MGERRGGGSVWCGGVYGVGECKERGSVWNGSVLWNGRVRECIKWGSVWTWEGHFLIFGAKIQILFKLGKYSFAFISFTST